MPTTPESSLDLIARVRAGDTTALDLLIARYRPRLMRWASGRLPRSARGMAETQDLVQETLISAFRRIDSIDVTGEGALQAYLRQVLLNAIRMEIRRANRRPSGTGIDEALPSPGTSPLEAAIGREALDRYETALNGLRPADRELIVAHVEFEFDHAELASAFGKPSANAARMALQRALVRLAEAMRGLQQQ